MEWYDSYLSRLTWQAAEKHKFNFTMDFQAACNCGSTSAATKQEAAPGYRFDPNRLMQFSWTSTQTSRLLLEAGATIAVLQWNTYLAAGADASHVRIQDQGLGINYANTAWHRGDPNEINRNSERFSLSYVTGSHNFKTGLQAEQLLDNVCLVAVGNSVIRMKNGVPNRITQRNGPYLQRDRTRDIGIYAQDQWVIDRLTLNLGVRLDTLYGHSPQQDTAAPPNGRMAAPFARQSVAALNGLRQGRGHAQLERYQSAHRRCLRPVGHRTDGDQGVDWPVCGQDRNRDYQRQ